MSGELLPRGSTAEDPFELAITPERAGWDFSGLRILDLPAGGSHAWDTGEDEVIVLPLAGACSVSCDGERFELEGRSDPFSQVTDFAYVPREAHLEVTSSSGGRFAFPSARASSTLEARHVAAADVAVELRGAGQASRQVNNFCSPDAFAADRLIAVEVLTPAGNWSPYPPHKHDEERPGEETALEEIYYFEVAGGPSGAGFALVADARLGLEALRHALQGWSVADEYGKRARSLAAEWDSTVERAYTLGHAPLPAQSEVIGVVNRVSEPRDVVVCAAGSMPGDLHKLWRTRDPKGYRVEYGYSCMGYEIAGGLGVKMAAPDREVFVMVGDGSYLMMAQEIVTAVQEGIKLTIVLVQNHGFASIGELSESLGSQRFGTRYRFRGAESGRLDGDVVPVDLAANAASMGADVLLASTIQEFESALEQAVASPRTTVVQVHTDPLVPAPSSEGWWDVPVAEVSALDGTRAARSTYDRHKQDQRRFISTGDEAK